MRQALMDITVDIRRQFEEFGEPIVTQIIGRPYMHPAQHNPHDPIWAGNDHSRRHAVSWLKEKQKERETREARLFWVTVTATIAAIMGAVAAIVAAVEGWN